MYTYRFIVLALLALSSSTVLGQTVRFETSLGNFDIELFPDKAPLNVANFLQYVTSGRYDNTVINRAVPDFVLQMGSFSSPTLAPPPPPANFIDIVKFPPVPGESAESTGLSNTRGMVGLATSFNNINSGTSSFFINWGDNSFLDPNLSVFGFVPNMATVDLILHAPQINLEPGGQNLALINIPLQPNGNLVFINAAYVIPEPASCVLCGSGILLCVRRRLR